MCILSGHTPYHMEINDWHTIWKHPYSMTGIICRLTNGDTNRRLDKNTYNDHKELIWLHHIQGYLEWAHNACVLWHREINTAICGWRLWVHIHQCRIAEGWMLQAYSTVQIAAGNHCSIFWFGKYLPSEVIIGRVSTIMVHRKIS